MINVVILYCIIMLIMAFSLLIFRKLFGNHGVVIWMLFWSWIIATLSLVFFSMMTGLIFFG